MSKYLEYIVVTITALIFTAYHAVLTSLVLARFDYLNFSFGYIFWVECVAFIPLGIGMVLIVILGKKYPILFTSLTFEVILKHALFVFILSVVHAFWQSYVNSIFFGETFTISMFRNDFLAFIEMRFLAYIIMVGLVSGLIKIREEQKIILKESTLSLKLQKAKLKELEFKMNPEIIYPNLGFIKEQAEKNPEVASQMVILMAGILRKLVDNIEDEKVMLSEEVTFFKLYADLIKLRMKKSFNVVTNVNEEISAEKVPSMILLIPLIEELFFGAYRNYLMETSEIEFTVTKDQEKGVEEVITFKSITDSAKLFSCLKKDSRIESISRLLGNLAKGDVQFIPEYNANEIHLKLISSGLHMGEVYEK